MHQYFFSIDFFIIFSLREKLHNLKSDIINMTFAYADKINFQKLTYGYGEIIFKKVGLLGESYIS
jgi:hypothetical protein